MKIDHIPGAKNPADALTRKAWFGKQKEMEGVKQEEDLWMRQWRNRTNKTEAQLQETVQQMYQQQPQVMTDNNSFNSFNSLSEGVDLPKLMVMKSEVKVDQTLKTQIINSLAADLHYEDMLLKLEEGGDNAEIPTEQGTYRVKEGMLVFHPRSPLVQDGPYWKMVIPDDNEIKRSEEHTSELQSQVPIS